MSVINLDSKRGLIGTADVWERRFRNDVKAAIAEFVWAGRPLDDEKITDALMTAYGDTPDAAPDAVRRGARRYIGNLVRATIQAFGAADAVEHELLAFLASYLERGKPREEIRATLRAVVGDLLIALTPDLVVEGLEGCASRLDERAKTLRAHGYQIKAGKAEECAEVVRALKPHPRGEPGQ